MNINKEKVMSTRTKFQDIKEQLNNNYHYVSSNHVEFSEDGRYCSALKNALDKLLELLDDMVRND